MRVISWVFFSRCFGNLLIAFLIVSGCVNAVELVEVGHWSVPPAGQVSKVKIVGDRVYAAAGSAGLMIFDAKDPANMVFLGSYDTPGYAVAVDIKDNIAFVADGAGELQIIDVTDSANPTRIGVYYAPSSAASPGGYAYGPPYDPSAAGSDVVVHGNTLYFADGGAGLFTFDITDPSKPVLLGQSTMGSQLIPGGAKTIAVGGNFLILTVAQNPAQLLDISNRLPSLVYKIGSPVLDYVTGAAISGNRAYVTFGDGRTLQNGRVEIFDLSNTSSRVALGTYQTGGEAESIAVSGNLAVVADGAQNALHFIDVSDPTKPQMIARFTGGFSPGSVNIVGSRAFVSEQPSGLNIVDISDPANARTIGRLDPDVSAWALKVVGNHAYVASYGGGLQILNVSDPTNPVRVGGVRTRAKAVDVAAEGDLAIVADYSGGAQIVDVSNPANPKTISTFNTLRNAWGVDIVGKRAYVASGYIYILDLTEPRSPRLLGTYPPDEPGYFGSIKVKGDLAFVSNGLDLGVTIVNVADPVHPFQVGSLTNATFVMVAEGIDVQGHYAYIATGVENGLTIFDLANPFQPQKVAAYGPQKPGGYFAGVAISGDFAYLADNENGVVAFDVSQPENPIALAKYDTAGGAFDVSVVGNTLYVADYTGGVRILEMRAADYIRLQIDGGGNSSELHATGLSTLQIRGQIGKECVLESAPDLQMNGWTEVQTFTLSQSPYSISIPDTLHGKGRFYRVRAK